MLLTTLVFLKFSKIFVKKVINPQILRPIRMCKDEKAHETFWLLSAVTPHFKVIISIHFEGKRFRLKR